MGLRLCLTFLVFYVVVKVVFMSVTFSWKPSENWLISYRDTSSWSFCKTRENIRCFFSFCLVISQNQYASSNSLWLHVLHNEPVTFPALPLPIYTSGSRGVIMVKFLTQGHNTLTVTGLEPTIFCLWTQHWSARPHALTRKTIKWNKSGGLSIKSCSSASNGSVLIHYHSVCFNMPR